MTITFTWERKCDQAGRTGERPPSWRQLAHEIADDSLSEVEVEVDDCFTKADQSGHKIWGMRYCHGVGGESL
jgi:hypothetical protein